jgi:hypothetical protein
LIPGAGTLLSTVGYKGKMKDGDDHILTVFVIKVAKDTTLTQTVAVRQVRER